MRKILGYRIQWYVIEKDTWMQNTTRIQGHTRCEQGTAGKLTMRRGWRTLAPGENLTGKLDADADADVERLEDINTDSLTGKLGHMMS